MIQYQLQAHLVVDGHLDVLQNIHFVDLKWIDTNEQLCLVRADISI